MRPSLNVLNNFKLASPCDVAWDSMYGTDKQRFCGACKKNVYNLLNMDVEEIATLIEATEGRFCGRMYQRADGTLLTEDCPVGFAKLMRNARRRTARAAVSTLAFLAAGASFMLFGRIDDPRVVGPTGVVTPVIETIGEVISPEPPTPVAGGLMPEMPIEVGGEIEPAPAPEPSSPPEPIIY